MKKSDIFFGIWLIVSLMLLMIMGCHIVKLYKQAKKPPEIITIERNISPIPYDDFGIYTISHYCDCPICTGTPKGSRTATGTKPKEGRTIACDGKILKMGDIVYIENYGIRICEDKGGAIKGNRIDVYVNEHNKAVKMGIKRAKIYKIGE